MDIESKQLGQKEVTNVMLKSESNEELLLQMIFHNINDKYFSYNKMNSF